MAYSFTPTGDLVTDLTKIYNDASGSARPMSTEDFAAAESSAMITALGEGIVAKGYNSNGSYIKFRDGTMICYGRHATFPVWSPVGSNAFAMNYPVAFYNNGEVYNNFTTQPFAHWSYSENGNQSNYSQVIPVISNYGAAQNVQIWYFAIGRWKA